LCVCCAENSEEKLQLAAAVVFLLEFGIAAKQTTFLLGCANG
jgi:hypothetical protein